MEAHQFRLSAFVAALLVPAVVCSVASAEPVRGGGGESNRSRAADAYDRGAEALEHGDLAEAATYFERAHRIQPSDVAREQAIACYERAGEHVKAASLALESPESAAQHADLLAKVAADNARVSVRCDHCALELDGKPAHAHELIVAPGSHRVRAHFAHGASLRRFEAEPGAHVQLSLSEPQALQPLPSPEPAAADPVPRERGGVPAAVTFALLGLTAAGVGASTWSVIDMNAVATHYQRELATAKAAPSAASVARASEVLEQAQAAQRRTTWLVGTSAVVGAASALVALLWTDWGEHEHAGDGPTLALSPSRAVAGWRQSW